MKLNIIVILGDCDAEDVKDFFVDPNLISIANRPRSPKEQNRLLHHQEIFNSQHRIGNTSAPKLSTLHKLM